MLYYNHPTIQNDLKEVSQCPLQWFHLNKKKILVLGGTNLETVYFIYSLMYLKEHNGIDLRITILTENESNSNTLYDNFLTDKSFNLVNYHPEQPIHYIGRIDYIIYFQKLPLKNNDYAILKQTICDFFNITNLCKDKEPEGIILYTSRDIIINEDTKKNIHYDYTQVLDTLEILLKLFSEESGIPYKIIKNPYTYGPGIELDGNSKSLFNLLSHVVRQSSITINEEVHFIKPYCYVTDTIIGILQVLLYGQNKEIYNLSNEEERYNLNDIIAYLKEIYPHKYFNIVIENKTKSSFISIPPSDTQKIRNIGWEATINLREGIKRIITTLI